LSADIDDSRPALPETALSTRRAPLFISATGEFREIEILARRSRREDLSFGGLMSTPMPKVIGSQC